MGKSKNQRLVVDRQDVSLGSLSVGSQNLHLPEIITSPKRTAPPLYFQSQRLQPHKAEEVKQSKALKKVNDTVEIGKKRGNGAEQ